MISLKEAIGIYKGENPSLGNSYNWFRSQAKDYGYILIGNVNVKAQKIGRAWEVHEAEFLKGMESDRQKKQEVQQNTIDYKNNKIHGLNIQIMTEWGSYINYGLFREVRNDYEIVKRRNFESWVCNSCSRLATLEHKREECHLCKDWNGCETDCTLSLVKCIECKTEIKP